MKTSFQKNLGRTVLMLLLGLGIFSCSKDSDPSPSGGTGVEGNWNLKAFTVTPAINGVTDYLALIKALGGGDCLERITFIFKANGVIDGNAPAECKDYAEDNDFVSEKSTWKVLGNKIQLTEDGDVTEFDLEVNGTEMKWSETDIDNGVSYKYSLVFKRQ